MKRVLQLLYLLAALLATAAAHGPVEKKEETFVGDARLFVANYDSISAIDLPSGSLRASISVPQFPMTMHLTEDNAHLLVFRGRDNDRQFVTVIDPAVHSNASGPYLRLPAVEKTLLLNDSMGFAVVHPQWGPMLKSGQAHLLYRFRYSHLNRLSAFPIRTLDTGLAGHQNYVPAGPDALLVGHLSNGIVRLIDIRGNSLPLKNLTGIEVDALPCLVSVGAMGVTVKRGDRMVDLALFGCLREVIVIDIITRRQVAALPIINRRPNGSPDRVAAFRPGAPDSGVVFGTNDAGDAVFRINLTDETPTVSKIQLPAVQILGRTGALPADPSIVRHFFVLVDGSVAMMDAATGALLAQVQLNGKPFDPATEINENVDKAIRPIAVPFGDHVFVSLPNAGQVVELQFTANTLVELRRFSYNFNHPTRLLIAGPSTACSKAPIVHQ